MWRDGHVAIQACASGLGCRSTHLFSLGQALATAMMDVSVCGVHDKFRLVMPAQFLTICKIDESVTPEQLPTPRSFRFGQFAAMAMMLSSVIFVQL